MTPVQQQELISPAQSEQFVLIAAGLLLLIGAAWGYRALGQKGLLAGLLGPLLWALWQGHKWITRYDPKTDYFGLDKVWVLLFEVAVFIMLGAALGFAWGRLMRRGKLTAEHPPKGHPRFTEDKGG